MKNRTERARIGQETVNILARGDYVAPSGQDVSIREALDNSCAATQLYRPGEVEALAAELEKLPRNHACTRITVTSQKTLEAAADLVDDFPALACLNFASAKNPGGGFLNGSLAQEESLAIASGLYAALQTQPGFYAYHRQLGSTLYSDHLIASPGVPVFRDDQGLLLERPFQATFLTAAAPNAGAVRRNEPNNAVFIRETLERRARLVLTVAALQRGDALILGAWGWGVFGNDPVEVAQVFAAALADPVFERRFARIVFAVHDSSAQQTTLGAFQQTFPGCYVGVLDSE